MCIRFIFRYGLCSVCCLCFDVYFQTETVQVRLHKSLKLWTMYADLEESFGSFKTTKAVYDRIIDLKIATPLIIMNYGMFLEENNYFEEMFKVTSWDLSAFALNPLRMLLGPSSIHE